MYYMSGDIQVSLEIKIKAQYNLILNRWYRVFRKNCVFSQFTATPPSPTTLWETFKALKAMRVYSHSYWLVIFCTTTSNRVPERDRWQTFENSWKKNQYLMNTLYKTLSHTEKNSFQLLTKCLLLHLYTHTHMTSSI